MRGKQRPVEGRIGPGELLTADAVMRAIGIGRPQLMLARKSKIVKPYPCGGNVYYKSEEVIAWILSGGGKSNVPS